MKNTPPAALAARRPGRPLRRMLSLMAAAALCSATAAFAGDAEDALPLPPPPAVDAPAAAGVEDEAQRPAVDLTLIQSAEDGSGAQELWSGDDSPMAATPQAAPSAASMAVPVAAAKGASSARPAAPAARRINHFAPRTVAMAAAPAIPAMGTGGDLNEVLQAVSQEAGSHPETDLIDQLRQVMPDGGAGYLFDKAVLPDLSGLPAGARVHYDFKLPARGLGSTPFQATVLGAEGKSLRRFSGSIQIDREAHGVQVTRVVRQGETLRAEDLKPLQTRLSLLPRGAYDDAATLAGTTARSELRPGQWLTEQMLETPQVVKRNQAVTIRLSRGPILITTPGVTRQDGALGEVIKVENVQSKREVYARVTSPDQVQVIF